MRKKLLAILLTAAMTVTLLSGTALAFSGSTVGGGGDVVYNPYSCGINVTWSYSDGVLTIEGTGTMNDFLFFGPPGPDSYPESPWHYDEAEIVQGTHTVVIGDGVLSIGHNAFYNFANLTSVTIPASVTHIGLGAFEGCTSLNVVNYGGSESQWGEILGYNAPAFQDYDEDTGEFYYDFMDEFSIAFSDGGLETVKLDGITVNYGSAATDPAEPETPAGLVVVPEASDTSYVLESGGSVTIYCTGELSDFIRLLVDGEEVDPSNYTLEEGSTVITLISAFLDTLSVGQHTVELEFTTGTARTTITVRALDSTPQTGDNSMMTVWVGLALMSLAGMGVTILYSRKVRR